MLRRPFAGPVPTRGRAAPTKLEFARFSLWAGTVGFGGGLSVLATLRAAADRLIAAGALVGLSGCGLVTDFDTPLRLNRNVPGRALLEFQSHLRRHRADDGDPARQLYVGAVNGKRLLARTGSAGEIERNVGLGKIGCGQLRRRKSGSARNAGTSLDTP